MITQAKCHELFEYSDGSLYWKVDKGTAKAGKGSHANGNGYMAIKVDGKPYLEHKLVWLWHTGDYPKYLDHIDRNPLNNRIDNLRLATHSENMRNTAVRKDSKSGVKGVSWCKTKNKWKVQVCYDGKQQYLGRYSSLDKAKEVAIAARALHHGAFTNHGDK